jgi:two-component system sensor histidine kinase/response regulator
MSAQAQPKILVIDDNAENLALAQATLDDEGYQVVLAGSGEEGIRKFEAEQPDCVLLDVRMPDMDGFEVCGRIRASAHGADTPVVFLTALRDVDTFDRALRAGGDDFLTKPVRPTELIVRVQAALKLRRMSAELREHYELVRRQRDDLMRVQLQKERLSAFVVHDLKNPVSTMDLHAQLLLRERGLSEGARESVLRIREEARSLLRLLLDLLDISKSEEGALVAHVESVDLPALLAEVTAALAIKAEAARVSFACAIEVDRVSADRDLLRRVLENLIENAIRHAPAGSRVGLGAHVRDDGVEIRVADAGPGIPADMRERIFDPFVQVESGDRVMTRTGRGLGLTFCRLAIEAHRGRIWVEDGAPGSVFYVRLPHEQ